MATPDSINTSDLAAMGIDLNADKFANDTDTGINELDLNDPDIAALIQSFEEQAPTPQELAEKIARESSGDPATGTNVTTSQDTATKDAPATSQDPKGEPAPTATDNTPGTTNDSSDPGDPGDPGSQNVIADTFLVDLGNGQTAQITQEDATRLIGLDQWARSLPENTIRSFAAIESGDAIAIPRSQYDQFALWLAGQSGNGQASTNTGTPNTIPPPDEFADDTTKALYQQVQQLQQTVQQQQQQQVDYLASQQVAQMEVYLQQRADVFENSFNEVAKNYGLNDAETIAALNYAANARLVQSVNNELTVINPATGAVIRDADPAQVAQVTFERAVMLVPELRQKAIDQQVQTRLDAERNAITATNQKKNRAASLSSAPAAATSTNRNVREMSSQEIEAAIAAELRAAIG